MKLAAFTYMPDRHWSVNPFPKLDSAQTLVVVFGAAEYGQDTSVLNELAGAYPNSTLIGCSTAGEIAGAHIYDGSLSVAVLQFERSRIAHASAEINSGADCITVSRQLAESLNKDGLRGVFVLSDGLKVNGSELVSGLNSSLPADVIVTGGLAGDGNRFGRTWVIRHGRPESGIISATGFYGDSLCITHGSRGGWDSFGPERCITRSEANVLYELDGKPALALYKKYLGERASGLPATGLLFPLAIRQGTADEHPLVRTILAVDEATQSMTFAGNVPVGYLAQLMRANFDRLLNGASVAADQAKNIPPSAGPILAIAISCVGRRLVLGERTEEETEVTLESFPPGTEQIGFYSYGEISPFASGACDLHNQTMTLTTFSEG
jgi:hypothetical protein